MARFCTLCSSSSGNSTYIGYSNSGILIDAGTSAKRLTAALAEINIAPESISAILVTHEHSDHIGALRVFASRYDIPVIAAKGTLEALDEAGHLRGVKSLELPDGKFEIADMEISCFKTSHDSAQSRGYTVTLPDERRISIVTDTGYITDDILEKATGSDLILLESNYDKNMLENGPYPYCLKQRILSKKGHLSNDDCAKAACHFVQTGTSRLILGHLSRENNTPALAYKSTCTALREMGASEGTDFTLDIAPPGIAEKTVIF